jgi:hypothetical protein
VTCLGFRQTRAYTFTNRASALAYWRSRLVVKLAKERVDELVASGAGGRFDPRHDGRLMKEWVTIPARQRRDWDQLVSEALQFVRSA